MLTEEARRARNAYRRAYYHAHPERQRASNERYWERKAKALAEAAEAEAENTEPSNATETPTNDFSTAG